jgi:hypothetical protein
LTFPDLVAARGLHDPKGWSHNYFCAEIFVCLIRRSRLLSGSTARIAACAHTSFGNSCHPEWCNRPIRERTKFPFVVFYNNRFCWIYHFSGGEKSWDVSSWWRGRTLCGRDYCDGWRSLGQGAFHLSVSDLDSPFLFYLSSLPSLILHILQGSSRPWRGSEKGKARRVRRQELSHVPWLFPGKNQFHSWLSHYKSPPRSILCVKFLPFSQSKLGQGPFFGGDSLLLSDLYVCGVMHGIATGSWDFIDASELDKYPTLLAHYAAVKQHPHVVAHGGL